jgi:hypothetical protein
VFECVTLEGWTMNMMRNEQAVGSWVIAYHFSMVVIGAWFLFNLAIAVITTKFSEEHEHKLLQKAVKKRGPKGKRVVADDSEDDWDDEDDPAAISKKVPLSSDPYAAIEALEITPDEKRALKEKLRIETLIKKYELAIKHREVRDKVTPRNDNSYMSNSIFSS